MNEDLEDAASRELLEETSVMQGQLEQLGAYGNVIRDPRGRVVSIAYYAFVDKSSVKPKASSDARNVKWYDVKALPLLAFDHQLIIEDALQRARKNKEIK